MYFWAGHVLEASGFSRFGASASFGAWLLIRDTFLRDLRIIAVKVLRRSLPMALRLAFGFRSGISYVPLLGPSGGVGASRPAKGRSFPDKLQGNP